MQVLSANRLGDGKAVWFAADHSWVESIEAATIAGNRTAADALLAFARNAVLRNEVVDANLVDVALSGGRVVPARLRERIRAAGPTIRTDFLAPVLPAIATAA